MANRSSLTDTPPKGLSKGDRFHDRSRLLNATRQFGKPAGAVVGRDEVVLVMTRADRATFTGVAHLPGFRGVMDFSRSASATVTGGTGR